MRTSFTGGAVDVDLDEFDPDEPTVQPDPDEPKVQSPDEEIEDAIGGGAYPDAGVSIGVDEEGRATETITTGTGGPGSTNYGGPAIAADPDTDPVGTVESDESRQTLEKVEQAVEEATGGTAFGDRDEVEDIGSGEAVTQFVDEAERQTRQVMQSGGSGGGGIPWALVGVLLLVIGGAFAYTRRE
jgi:hypothetical protein